MKTCIYDQQIPAPNSALYSTIVANAFQLAALHNQPLPESGTKPIIAADSVINAATLTAALALPRLLFHDRFLVALPTASRGALFQMVVFQRAYAAISSALPLRLRANAGSRADGGSWQRLTTRRC